MKRNKKGFTLIEMLVVIAIIAVLVAIVIPVVNGATTKAKAATDAANMRSILGTLNVLAIDKGRLTDADVQGMSIPASKMFPDATLNVEYCESHYIRIYYVDSGKYYGLDYFAAIAETGKVDESISTAEPATDPGITWFTIVTSNG